MYRKLIVIAFVFIACIDFDIDAPYDDINGIYLENIISYDFTGWKIAVENQKGYILDLGETDIVCYNFADVSSIDTISLYQSVYLKPDFVIANGYGYIVSQNFGLEIVDFHQTTPQHVGSLPISADLHSIILSDNHAFITGNTKLFAIDVSDVGNPTHITEYAFNSLIMKADVASDTLYILLHGGVLQIIDIATPTSPQLIAEHNLSDTVSEAEYFVKNHEHLYVSKGYDIETYEIHEDGALEYQNTLSFSHKVDFLNIYGEYGLCFHRVLGVLYLLNLSYPSRPCISEYKEPGGTMLNGVIENPYIYFLHPNLSILEIKEIAP
jgi:hypothetical protein